MAALEVHGTNGKAKIERFLMFSVKIIFGIVRDAMSVTTNLCDKFVTCF